MGNKKCARRRLAGGLLVGAVIVAVTGLAAQEAATPARGKVAVKPVGIQVIADFPEDQQSLRPFMGNACSAVALLAEPTEGSLIGLDDETSKIEAFTDDRGRSLFKEDPPGFSEGLGSFPKFSEDGKKGVIEIQGKNGPSPDATALLVKGTLAFKVASKTETVKSAAVAVAKDTKFKLGGFDFEIEQAGKPDWGDEPLQITLATKKSMAGVKEVRFLDEQGAVIESSEAGSMRSPFGESREYKLAKKIDKVVIEMVSWTDLRTVKVPLDLRVSVGLGTPAAADAK